LQQRWQRELRSLQCNNSHNSSSNRRFEELTSDELENLVDELMSSTSLISHETDRLLSLMKAAERRYGGDKYETAATAVWADHLHHNSSNNQMFKKAKTSSNNNNNDDDDDDDETSKSETVGTRQPLIMKKKQPTNNSSYNNHNKSLGYLQQTSISDWLTRK
jgi:hypothetical protein